MKLAVNLEEFRNALTLAMGSVETKVTIPILGHVLLEAGADRLRIAATDLDTAMEVTIPAEINVVGAVTVPAKKLLQYVRQLSGETLDIAATPTHWVSLACGASKARIAGDSKDSWAASPTPPEKFYTLPLPELQRMIRIAMVAIPVPGELLRTSVMAALLGSDGALLRMTAFDGSAVTIAETPSVEVIEPVLVSQDGLQQVLRLEGPTVDYAFNQNNCWFRSASSLLTARRIVGKIPNLSTTLSMERTAAVTVDRKKFKEAVARAIGFSDGRTNVIRFSVNGKFEVFGSTENLGYSSEEIECEIYGTSDVKLNGVYVADILGALVADKVVMRLEDHRNGVVIEAVGPQRQFMLVGCYRD